MAYRVHSKNNLGSPTSERVTKSDQFSITKSKSLAKDDDLRGNPIRNANAELVSRYRSLSAGRAPQQGAGDIIRNLYDKIGVNQNSFSTVGENNNMRKKNTTYPSNRLCENEKVSTVSGTCGVDRQPSTPSWIRGRQSPDSASPTAIDSNTSDNSNQRRSRSLSRGRINYRWPHPSDAATNSATYAQNKISSTVPRNVTDLSLTSNNTTDKRNIASPTIEYNAYKRNEDKSAKEKYSEEKKIDEVVSDMLSHEDAVSPTPTTTVKERLRLYGSSVLDEKNNIKLRSSAGAKNVTINYTNRTNRVYPDFGGRVHPPKINVFEECNQKIHHSMNDDSEQSCHSETVVQHLQTCNSHSLPIHGSGEIHHRASCFGDNCGKQRTSHVASAFLTAIAQKSQSVAKRDVTSPVFEIQTTEDNETHSDTISISLSSVSADDYQRHISSPTPTGVDYFSRNYHNADGRKFSNSSHQHNERNRLSAYNNGSGGGPIRAAYSRSGTSADSGSSATHKSIISASADMHQSVPGTNNAVQQQEITRLETIIEDRVNARMSEYETRMEKLILKFMQTVDEKMSSRMQDLESRINTFHLDRNSSSQQLRHQQQQNQSTIVDCVEF